MDSEEGVRAAQKHMPNKAISGSRKHKKLVVVFIICIIFVSIGFLAIKIFCKKHSSVLPNSIVQMAPFPIFFYPHTIPGNFHLVPESIKYSSGYLISQLTTPDKSQTITITEQSVPSNLAASTVIGKEKVDGTENNATLSFDGSRMIGYMISKDKQTFVIINAPEGLEESTMKDLLRGLKKL
jgi:hypothetical protein